MKTAASISIIFCCIFAFLFLLGNVQWEHLEAADKDQCQRDCKAKLKGCGGGHPLNVGKCIQLRRNCINTCIDGDGGVNLAAFERFAKLLPALKEAQEAFSTLQSLKQAAEDALSGRPISAGDNWPKLADRYTAAADQAREAPLPSQFQTKNVVSAAELTSCATRTASIHKLRSYLQELRGARSNGKASLEQIDQRLAEIPSSREMLNFLSNVHEKLMTVPDFGRDFAFDWLDIETRVRPALGGIESALKAQRSRFADDLTRINMAVENLQANLNQLSSLNCSAIAGTWSGTPGAATAQFGGSPFCTYQVAMENLQLQVIVQDNGTVAGTTLSGTMTESTVAPCPHAPLGNRPHSYSGGGTTAGSNINLQLGPAESNQPKCQATFNGAVTNGRLQGTLTIRRVDIGGNLTWQTTHSVQ